MDLVVGVNGPYRISLQLHLCIKQMLLSKATYIYAFYFNIYIYIYIYQYVFSLVIEPTTFCAANAML